MPDRLAGIHLNLMTLRRDPAPLDRPTEDEARYQEQLDHWLREETGYQAIQGTKPQTLAYGLTDSPVGLAAWIVEKFRTWSDCGGDVERRFSKDELLTNITIYWATGAIGSSFWPYYARIHDGWPLAGRRSHRGAHGATPRSRARSCIPPRALGRARLRHPALDGDAGRAATSPPSRSPRRSPARSAPSSATSARHDRVPLGPDHVREEPA